MGTMISAPVHCPTLIDRREQLDFLLERLQDAARGHGCIVFIGGDAGSGKTRLAAEFCTVAQQRGFRTATGQCLQYAQVPFGPIAEALAVLLSVESGTASSSHVRAGRPARIIPELRTEPASAPFDPSEKLAQFEGILNALAAAAEKGPVGAVLEDLHWADGATSEFLEHAAKRLPQLGACIVGTYRADALPRRHALHSLIAKLERFKHFWLLELGPLDDSDMQSLIAQAVPKRSAIDPETALAVRAKAEGNPLFAEELLRSVLAGGHLPGRRKLPRSVREAVVERLGQLREDEQKLIVCAAAVGRHFTPDLLCLVTQTERSRVLEALKRGVELALIEELDDGSLVFRHALTREAVYSELLAAEARPLHAMIAQAIERQPDAAQRVAELAYQWWSAGDQAKTAEFNERAGDAAEKVFASQDAVVYFERALQALAEGDPRRNHLWRKLGAALYSSGLGGRALTAYRNAIEGFAREGEREYAAASWVELARLQWTIGYADDSLASTERALEIIGDKARGPVWFAAVVQKAWTAINRESAADDALNLLAEAEPHAAAAHVRDKIKFFEAKAMGNMLCGRPHEALANASDAAAAAADEGDAKSAVRCWANIGIFATGCGEQPAADEAFARAVGLIDRERPLGWQAPWALALCAYSHYRCGRLHEAGATIRRALDAIVDVQSLDVLLSSVAIPLGLRTENAELVERCANEALIEFAFRSGSSLIGAAAGAFAEYFLSRGRENDAKALLARALDRLQNRPSVGDYDTVLLLSARYGDAPQAAVACSVLEKMTREIRVRSAPAHLALVTAWRERRFGSADLAEASALRAAKLFEEIGWPLHHAQALEVAGKLAEACQIYARVGDAADRRRLEATISPANRRGRRKDELSPREQEIAELIIAGMSNREIADRLVLSERTVESHVASIFSKLSLTARTQLAGKLKASKS
jgi:DNA-binding CsgD family transcriptional regulator